VLVSEKLMEKDSRSSSAGASWLDVNSTSSTMMMFYRLLTQIKSANCAIVALEHVSAPRRYT
jgi:hypothetical protein